MRGRKNPAPADQPPPNLPPCKVCGEQGTGFHYGVTTCGACKGFFRRSLVRHEPYVCTGSGCCHIGLETKRRKSCPKCRYEKCLEVGMSKGAIKTGRYSYVKKSHDILEMIQHQYQHSTSSSSSSSSSADCTWLERDEAKTLKSERCFQSPFPSCALDRNSDTGTPFNNKFMELSPLRSSHSSQHEFTFAESPRSRKRLQDFDVQDVSDMIPPFQTHVMSDVSERTRSESNVVSPEHQLPNSTSQWERAPSDLDLHSSLSSSSLSSSCMSSPMSVGSDRRHVFQIESTNNFLSPPQEAASCPQLSEPTTYIRRACPDDSQPVNYENTITDSCYTPVCMVNLKTTNDGSNYMNMEVLDRNYPQNTHELWANNSTQDFTPHGYVIVSRELSTNPSEVSEVNGIFNSVSRELEKVRRASWEEMSFSEESLPHQTQEVYTKSRMGESHDKLSHQETSHRDEQLPTYSESDQPHQDVQQWDTNLSASFTNCPPLDGSLVSTNVSVSCDSFNSSYVTELWNVPVETFNGEAAWHTEAPRVWHHQSLVWHHQGLGSDIQTIHGESDPSKIKQSEHLTSPDSCSSQLDHFLSSADEAHVSSPKRKKSGSVETESVHAIIGVKPEVARESCQPTTALRTFFELNEHFLNLWTPFNLLENPLADVLQIDQHPSRLQPNDDDYNERPLSWCEFTEAELDDIIMSLKKSHRKYVGVDDNQLSNEQLTEKENTFLELFVFKKVGKGRVPVVSKEVYYEILETTGLDVDGRKSCIEVWTKVMDETLQNTMRFFRSVPGFRDICLEDKVVLSKACIEDYTLLSWFRGVNASKDVIVHAENKLVIPIEYLLAVLPDIDKFINGTIAMSKRLRELELSLDEIIILKGIVIMSPDREQLREYDKVDRIYWRLHCCLLLCLLRRHSAPLRHYAKIITVLTDMRQISADSQAGFRKLKSEMVTLTKHIKVPLYMELFHNVPLDSQFQNMGLQ
ncbi:unnamed protein product [Lymnaea stagnalis]|uniref:Uncharacterized protein n=1 Tax=Lymnaea stagnalis TaxID=6523 RepID=A0AAV2HAQ2_LYMST